MDRDYIEAKLIELRNQAGEDELTAEDVLDRVDQILIDSEDY